MLLITCFLARLFFRVSKSCPRLLINMEKAGQVSLHTPSSFFCICFYCFCFFSDMWSIICAIFCAGWSSARVTGFRRRDGLWLRQGIQVVQRWISQMMKMYKVDQNGQYWLIYSVFNNWFHAVCLCFNRGCQTIICDDDDDDDYDVVLYSLTQTAQGMATLWLIIHYNSVFLKLWTNGPLYNGWHHGSFTCF